MSFSTVQEAIKDLQRGRCIIVVDDEHRENEGDLVLAAEKITPRKMNTLIRAGGLVTVPLKKDRLEHLQIPLMVPPKDNTEITKCKFTISVDHRLTTTTGISAHDRCNTVKALIDQATHAQEFSKPGHIFPLQYEPGGVMERPGHTEAAIDLCELAGLYPAAVMCEILNEMGNTAKLHELKEIAKEQGLCLLKIEDIVAYKSKDI